jgi:hypothetical protein
MLTGPFKQARVAGGHHIFTTKKKFKNSRDVLFANVYKHCFLPSSDKSWQLLS